jgi:hypothetical protein
MRPELDGEHAWWQPPVEEIVRRRGEQDLTAVPRTADPRGAMYGNPHEALADVGRLPGVNSHSYPRRGPTRPLVRRERTLGLNGRGDRILGPGEGDEEGVALRVYDDARVRLEAPAQELSMIRQHTRVVAPEVLQQPRGSLEIREYERYGPRRKPRHGRTIGRNRRGAKLPRERALDDRLPQRAPPISFQAVIVYAVVDDSLPGHLLGDSLEVFVRREDGERFIEEIRGDDPELARPLRIEERELETGNLN